MIKIKHKNSWKNVEDITKDDKGYSYKVSGCKDMIKAEDIEDVDLDLKEEVNPDGSVFRYEGKEPLKKPLKKSLRDRWDLLKARMINPDHEKAFLNIEQALGQSEDQESESNVLDQPESSPEPSTDPEDDQGLVEDNNSEDELPPTQMSPEELEQALKEEGYSDTEIAHILHGHTPQQISEEDMAAEQHKQELAQDQVAHEQNLKQDQEKHEQTVKQNDSIHDIELDHQKAMKELERDYAKRENDIRLKYLEAELAAKVERARSKS